MLQHSYLGPLIFLILINDLIAGCLLHKFMDDTTLSEIIPKGGCSNMPNILRDVVKLSGNNQVNINWSKTKKMLISTNSMNNANLLSDALCVNDNVIERVYSYKLLAIVIHYNLKWHAHVDQICAKASKRLHFLKKFQRLTAYY